MVVFTAMMCLALPQKAFAANVKLNKSKIVVGIDQKYQLKVKNTTKKVKWTTSNKAVAKVSKKGVITPKAVGSAKITANVDGKNYTCKVTVADYTGMSFEQQEVISYALQFVGNPYRYGGSSLKTGTDCSGFTMSVYKYFGYKLPHNAYSQIGATKKVKMKNIKPGDLIFYGSSVGGCNHVALYIGNNKVVHASTPATGIVISDYKYRNYVAVGRVLDTETYPSEDTEPSATDEDLLPGEEPNNAVIRVVTEE